MNVNVALLFSIVVLTVAEIGAVVAITLWGPRDRTSDVVTILIGIVGPIVASLVAVINAAAATARAASASSQAASASSQAGQAHAEAKLAQKQVQDLKDGENS